MGIDFGVMLSPYHFGVGIVTGPVRSSRGDTGYGISLHLTWLTLSIIFIKE
jgi:hypothetical protein